MLPSEIYVAGTGVGLPPERVTVEDAIALGRYRADFAARSEHLALTVAEPDVHAVDLAIVAGRQALDLSGFRPDDVGWLVFAVARESDMVPWSAAHYIQRGVRIADCIAFEFRAGCNGGALLEIAAPWLVTSPGRAVLLTAGDVWPDPWDRWLEHSTLLYGDGASALLLSAEAGWARIASIATRTDTELEKLIRGNKPWDGGALDISGRDDLPKWEIKDRLSKGVRAVRDRALAEADIPLSKIDHVLLPFSHRPDNARFLKALELGFDRVTARDWARTIGHTGAGDHFAGLHHLAETGALAPGHRVLALWEGAGYSWTAAVIEVIAKPYR